MNLARCSANCDRQVRPLTIRICQLRGNWNAGIANVAADGVPVWWPALVEEHIHRLRDGSVPLFGGVLVAQRGLVTGVAVAVHEFLGAGTGTCGEGGGQVAEVVEVEMVDADLVAGLVPCGVEDVWR